MVLYAAWYNTFRIIRECKLFHILYKSYKTLLTIILHYNIIFT